jgi:hypothetical protein
MMAVPNSAPVGSHGGPRYCADSCTSAATYDAPNDRAPHSRLSKCIRERYHHG